MDPKTLVLNYLDEAHATETALVTTLKAHITMATDASYRRLLERHLKETQAQVEAIDRRRRELGSDDGRGIVAGALGLARDAVGQALVLTKGPLDAVRTTSEAERMLKNAKDECATEALEIATYDHLEAAAKAAGDKETAKLAADHRKQEERMLAGLRKEIPKLAEKAFRDQTGSKPATTSRSSSGRTTRSRSSSSSRSTASRSKAASAKSSGRSSSSRSKSATTRSSGTSSRSTGRSRTSGSGSKS